MAARTAALKTAKLGAAFGASVAASGGSADCRAAPQASGDEANFVVDVLTNNGLAKLSPKEPAQQSIFSPDNIHQAASLLVASAHSDPLNQVTWSSDGSTPWLGLSGSQSLGRSMADSSAFDFESFIMLAEDVAKDPAVQRVILEREMQLQRRCLSASDSNVSFCESDLNDWSTAESQDAMHTAPASLSTSLAASNCGSDMLIVENQTLREENASLKAELRRVVPHLCSEQSPINSPVNEAKAIVDATIERAVATAATAATRMRSLPAGKASGTPAAGRSNAGMPYNAAVVAAAMVVGLLTILVSKNPASAKMAATAAAAFCLSLLQRVPPRRPSSLPSSQKAQVKRGA